MAVQLQSFSLLYRRLSVITLPSIDASGSEASQLLVWFEIKVECRSHRWSIDRRRFKVKTETIFFDSLRRRRAKAPYLDISLLQVSEIFLQRLDARRTEKQQPIVVKLLIGSEIVAHRAIHHRTWIVYICLIKHQLAIAFLLFRHNIEILLSVMLDKLQHKVV